MKQAIVINPADNVAVALQDVAAGVEISLPGGRALVAATDIPAGHKIALMGLDPGDPVVKYGEVIGRASERVEAGEWIHTHNMGAA